jgi:hypothetical protein
MVRPRNGAATDRRAVRRGEQRMAQAWPCHNHAFLLAQPNDPRFSRRRVDEISLATARGRRSAGSAG